MTWRYTLMGAVALGIWLVVSLAAGYITAQPDIFSSTADAKDYIAGASYRLPTYTWIVSVFGRMGTVALQVAVYVVAVVWLYAAAGRAWVALALAVNVTLVSLTHHGLTEVLAVGGVCADVYGASVKKWWLVSVAIAVVIMLRPIVPLPLDSYAQMAEINRRRFMAQVASCQHVFGSIGAYVYVARTNLVNGMLAVSNFGPAWVRVGMLVYNCALWVMAIACWRRANPWVVGIVAVLVVQSAITSAQGDRVLLLAVPLVLWGWWSNRAN